PAASPNCSPEPQPASFLEKVLNRRRGAPLASRGPLKRAIVSRRWRPSITYFFPLLESSKMRNDGIGSPRSIDPMKRFLYFDFHTKLRCHSGLSTKRPSRIHWCTVSKPYVTGATRSSLYPAML